MSGLAGDKSLMPTHEKVAKGEMRQLVKGIVTKLGNSRKHKRYDFLVIDEAQDIFDKGIDHIIKALLKVNNPLQNGSYFIFYDDSQDYPEAGDLSHYIRTREIFKSYAASYTLISNLRVNTGHGINEFIESAASGTIDILKDYGEDVIIKEWKKPEEVISLTKQLVTREKALGGQPQVKTLVLFTADLLKESSAFPGLLEKDGKFELMLAAGYSGRSEKIRYSTILKAKGLESDIVILVCSPLTNKRNIFQLFIGASRAKCRVYVLVKQI